MVKEERGESAEIKYYNKIENTKKVSQICARKSDEDVMDLLIIRDVVEVEEHLGELSRQGRNLTHPA